MLSTLRARIIVFCVGSLLLSMLGLAAANYWTVARQNEVKIHAQMDAAARSNATSLGVWVRAKRRVMESVKPAAGQEDPIPALKAAMVAGNFENAYVGYADKRHVFVNAKNLPPDFDPTGRPWYKMAVAADGPIITEPYKATSSGNMVVSFAEPVKDGNKVVAVVGGNITLERVIADVKAMKPTANSYAFLVGGNGAIIAHPDDKFAMQPATDVLSSLTTANLTEMAKSKATPEASLQGRDAYLRVSDVEGSNWKLVIALDKADAMAGLVAMVEMSLMATGLIVVIASLLLATLLTHSLRRLGEVRNAMQDVASGEGDLTLRIADQGKDELAQIARAYNQFADKLAGIIKGIRTNSESVKLGASEIATGNLDLSSRTEQQASSLEETASAMEELTSTVKQNADNAQQANQLALVSAGHAEKGGDIMGQVVNTMGSISASANKIADITGVIDSIAFQTNLLALNAAVEAARAGDQGRGFAVVAAEVRTLAQRSAAAAKEIKGLIGESYEKVTQGVGLVEKAGSTMTEIVTSIQRVTDITSEITAASQEQSAGISQVNQAISQMDTVTQQNAALVEEAAAAASSLQQQAEELAAAVGQFKLDDSPAHATPAARVATSPVRRAPVAPASAPRQAKAPAKAAAGGDGDWAEF